MSGPRNPHRTPWWFTLKTELAGCALLWCLASSQAQQRVVAYVPNWGDLKSFADTIDYAKLTHLNIAFENPSDEQGNLSFHGDNGIPIAKKVERFLPSAIHETLADASASRPARKPRFKVLAFYTGRNDRAHISFVREANQWFPKMAERNDFSYDATDNWTRLNTDFLSQFQVVLFLDTRPDDPAQRAAFKHYIENGGAWMGFHFAGFALTPSEFPQNWDWYHEEFLGSGSYVSNTWRPTSAVLRVEDREHPATKDLPETFASAPNEWYRWSNDLRKNPDIRILVSIDPRSFPLGTGPKAHEIWHSGYYPVVWTNKRYRMLYLNMGHNDMDYENKTNRELSSTFANDIQNKLILNGLLWLGGGSVSR